MRLLYLHTTPEAVERDLATRAPTRFLATCADVYRPEAETAVHAAERLQRTYSAQEQADAAERTARGLALHRVHIREEADRRAQKAALRVQRIPLGCDQQGKYRQAIPQPAEASTEIGAEPDAPLWPWLTQRRFWWAYAALFVGALVGLHLWARA